MLKSRDIYFLPSKKRIHKRKIIALQCQLTPIYSRTTEQAPNQVNLATYLYYTFCSKLDKGSLEVWISLAALYKWKQ